MPNASYTSPLANKEKANAQIAHLQFSQADAQTKNCKRAIFLPDQAKEHTFVFKLKGM